MFVITASASLSWPGTCRKLPDNSRTLLPDCWDQKKHSAHWHRPIYLYRQNILPWQTCPEGSGCCLYLEHEAKGLFLSVQMDKHAQSEVQNVQETLSKYRSWQCVLLYVAHTYSVTKSCLVARNSICSDSEKLDSWLKIKLWREPGHRRPGSLHSVYLLTCCESEPYKLVKPSSKFSDSLPSSQWMEFSQNLRISSLLNFHYFAIICFIRFWLYILPSWEIFVPI